MHKLRRNFHKCIQTYKVKRKKITEENMKIIHNTQIEITVSILISDSNSAKIYNFPNTEVSLN